VRRVWLLAGLTLTLACSNGRADSAAQAASEDTMPSGSLASAHAGRELIPAEWTIAEDTSTTGEVTTASLQLPAAREIAGLLDDESPRLVLRCFDGKVEAFIDTDPSDEGQPDSSSTTEPVRIQLDSAPSCE
jgi:hypothetical protein